MFKLSNLTQEVLLCKTRQDKTRQDQETDEFMDIRSRAEAAIQEKAIDCPDVSGLPTKGFQALVHELQVHQIELEMQNDELKRVQLPLEEARDKYQELYDSVPVGSGAIYLSDGSMRSRQNEK